MKAYLEAQKRHTSNIVYFCLEPTYDRFISVQRPKAVYEECFQAWRLGAIYKFSPDWPDDAVVLDSVESEFLALDQVLSESVKAPTRTKCEQLMYVFYATGELKYVDLYYQCIGVIRSPDVSKLLMRLWNDTREGYGAKLQELLGRDPNHFSGLNVSLADVDFSYFSRESLQRFRDTAENVRFAKKITHGKPLT